MKTSIAICNRVKPVGAGLVPARIAEGDVCHSRFAGRAGTSPAPTTFSWSHTVTNRYRSIAVIFALGFIAWLVFGAGAIAQSAQGLTPQEKRGKQIYLKGESEGGDIMASLGNDIELPATSFPCSNCHGLRGEGGSEGGLKPPAINWEALVSPHQSALTRNNRVAYNEATVNRAISMGIDASGNRLHPGMPRYRMTRAQVDDLIAYLKRIGKEADLDPGIGDETIKVGAALPITGELARIGEDIKSALGAYFTAVNARGGIYGRKFELVVEDSKQKATDAVEATKQLVERDKVFALVASFEPAGSEPVNEYIKQSQVPLVGPVTLSPRVPAVPNPFVFYLLPSFNDQSRSLVDFIASDAMQAKRPARKIAIVFGESDFDSDALAGVKSQAAISSLQIVAEQQYKTGQLSPEATISKLAVAKPDYVFFFGASDDFVRFASEMERASLSAALVSSTVMVGSGAFQLPQSIASRTYLAYPASLPTREDYAEFLGLMQQAGATVRSAAFQAVAFASAKVFVEAVRNCSRQLSRASLINSLESLRDFKTGVLPPVTFGPNRRIGAAGSFVVGIDVNNKKYIPLSERIVPKGSQ